MAEMILVQKTCTKCGDLLPVVRFSRDSKSHDGLQHVCKACFSEYNARRYASRPDDFKKAVREYRADNPEAVLATRMSTFRRRPSKSAARRCVEAAVAAGVLAKPHKCESCGGYNPDQRQWAIHAHHLDYSNPLDVVWLCPKCHAHAHMELRRTLSERSA